MCVYVRINGTEGIYHLKYWAMMQLKDSSEEERLAHRELQKEEEDRLFEKCIHEVFIETKLNKDLVVDFRKTWSGAKEKKSLPKKIK